MRYYVVHTDFGATGAVSVDTLHVIRDDFTAPIFRRWVGQPFRNLNDWKRTIAIEGPYDARRD